jgi:hypothetical protein
MELVVRIRHDIRARAGVARHENPEENTMMHDHTLKAILIGAVLAALHATPVSAGPAAFTWNPGAATPAINGGPFTADQISTTDFLFNRSDSAGLAFDDFILRIDSVSRNGAQVSASGLGSAYGLYLLGHVTLHAGPGGVSIYDSGTSNGAARTDVIDGDCDSQRLHNVNARLAMRAQRQTEVTTNSLS